MVLRVYSNSIDPDFYVRKDGSGSILRTHELISLETVNITIFKLLGHLLIYFYTLIKLLCTVKPFQGNSFSRIYSSWFLFLKGSQKNQEKFNFNRSSLRACSHILLAFQWCMTFPHLLSEYSVKFNFSNNF